MPSGLPYRLGPYQLIEEIGRGGMAVVYAAVDVRLQRPVALKVLPPELAFQLCLLAAGCAALALAACDHPDAARQQAARALKVISKLDCPATQGRLKLTTASADGLTCDYAADGVEVTLKLVKLNGAAPAAATAGANELPIANIRANPDQPRRHFAQGCDPGRQRTARVNRRQPLNRSIKRPDCGQKWQIVCTASFDQPASMLGVQLSPHGLDLVRIQRQSLCGKGIDQIGQGEINR